LTNDQLHRQSVNPRLSLFSVVFFIKRLIFADTFDKSSLKMNGLTPFSLPIKGLRDGIHEFQYEIGAEFFAEFPESPVQEGKLSLKVILDKQPTLFVLHFDFAGTVRTDCDRCLAEIDLPIGDQQMLIVKLSEENEVEDPEVIYIHPESSELNVGTFAYEFIVLAIPMTRTYDCVADNNRQCNMEMLDILSKNLVEIADVQDEPEIDENPIWSALKDLDINNTNERD
jgi:uncharacterized metal-binding protein YceD (DUF177 family)